jgi:hypothetical protein
VGPGARCESAHTGESIVLEANRKKGRHIRDALLTTYDFCRPQALGDLMMPAFMMM